MSVAVGENPRYNSVFIMFSPLLLGEGLGVR